MHAIIYSADQMIDPISGGKIVATVFGEASTRSGAVDITEGTGGIESQLGGTNT